MPQSGAGFLVGTSVIPAHQQLSEDGSMLDLDKAILDGDLAEFISLIDALFVFDSGQVNDES
jgi:hypothetical protein